MATLRDIKRRIRSVKSTEKITKAMEMVAAAKLRRAQRSVIAARPYARAMEEMLENLSAAAAEVGHPLFTERPVRNRLLVVISADRGLCGSYNANVNRFAEEILKGEDGELCRLFVLGRKARDYFQRRGYPMLEAHVNLPAVGTMEIAEEFSRRLQGHFLDGNVDEVVLVYTQFLSTMSRRVVQERFLPVTPGEDSGAGAVRGTLFEPDAGRLLESLLPRYANTKMLQALLESLASEHAARMVAMQSAHKNAGELIDALVLLRNRLRQAVITKEIAEIVGGAEALE